VVSPEYAIAPYHKHFYKADYTLHLRQKYSFNVRTVSDRTKRTEMGNKENLLGKFLPDGSTNIQRTGDEYYNIMPVWEWDKIPGITCRDFENDRTTTVQWGEPGNTAFVGGVSDGKYGCTAYDMNYNGVSAIKSWFFFDKEIVCLGAGISCTEGENVTTTLNQCWLRGNAFVECNKKGKLINETESFENPLWIWHDSVGYYFLQNTKATVSTSTQKGSWKKINETYSATELDGKVFKLFIGHGVNPKNETYAYCVLPALSLKEMHSYPIKNIEVVANKTELQAVVNSTLNMLQACFYKPGTLVYHQINLSVDKPCVILVKNAEGKNPEVWIADPAQKETEIIMTLQNGENKIVKKIVLPADEEKGKSVMVK
jgi:chondroitin AC lyase